MRRHEPVPVVPDHPPSTAPTRPKSGKVRRRGGTGDVKLPDERNGLVFVFRVFDKMSYALVMRSTRPIYVGDVVRDAVDAFPQPFGKGASRPLFFFGPPVSGA